MSGVVRSEASLLWPVPARARRRCGLASGTVMGLAAMADLPLWAIVSAGLLVWAPVLRREAAWAARQDGWMAFFVLLAVTQAAHVAEHCAQLVQIHVLGLRGAQARGVFGALDIRGRGTRRSAPAMPSKRRCCGDERRTRSSGRCRPSRPPPRNREMRSDDHRHDHHQRPRSPAC